MVCDANENENQAEDDEWRFIAFLAGGQRKRRLRISVSDLHADFSPVGRGGNGECFWCFYCVPRVVWTWSFSIFNVRVIYCFVVPRNCDSLIFRVFSARFLW